MVEKLMRTFSERSEKNLTGVHPDLVRVMRRALEITTIDFVVIEGLRTLTRQKQLVAAGASKTMNSRHLTGHAVDLCPLLDLDKDGKIETTEMFNVPLMRRLNVHIAKAFAEEKVAFEWGGDWGWDFPHYELHRAKYPA
jgi:peptidoglycan L-alanyl-D-glutamate endopeptidase CwlK